MDTITWSGNNEEYAKAARKIHISNITKIKIKKLFFTQIIKKGWEISNKLFTILIDTFYVTTKRYFTNEYSENKNVTM